MDIIEFFKTYGPFKVHKYQEKLLHAIENEDKKKPIVFNKGRGHVDTIVVDKKTLVWELPINKPFPSVKYEHTPWIDTYQERCEVRRPMMKDWVRHVCKDHDVLIEWR